MNSQKEFEIIELSRNRNVLIFKTDQKEKARELATDYLKVTLKDFDLKITGIYKSLEDDNQHIALYTILATKW